MESSVKLGRILGIPVGLHLSWFLIFGLMTWSLALGYFPPEYPGLPTAGYWLLGAVTSLLLFGSVLVHELAHSIVALRHKVPVRGITLFIFGGVAQMGSEPPSAGAEFRIAIAGPLASLALAIGFGGLWVLDQGLPYLAAPSMWLMRINLILAVFNLIPGFPLDGGRVLRAAIWKFTGSFQQATRAATFTGQLAAFGFIGVGVFTILRGNFFNGLWLVFIGWFLQNAAAASFAQSNLQQSLRGVRVGQVMSRDCPLVPDSRPLSQLVEQEILSGGRRCFFVADNGRLRGMLTLTDVARVPRSEWSKVTTGQIMVPWDKLQRVEPGAELLAALRTMDDANVNQLPVVEGDEMVGMLSRQQVLHYLRARVELGL